MLDKFFPRFDTTVPFCISTCSTLAHPHHALSHACRPTLAGPPSPTPIAVLPELAVAVAALSKLVVRAVGVHGDGIRGDGARRALNGGARGTLEGPLKTTGLDDAFFNYYYLIIITSLWLEPMVINHCHHRFGT